MRRYDEIQAGWRVFDRGAGWRTVTSVEIADLTNNARPFGARGVKGTGGDTGIAQQWIPMTHRINTKHVGFVGEAHETMTAYADRAEYDAKLAAALAYQDTLTVKGTPRKGVTA